MCCFSGLFGGKRAFLGCRVIPLELVEASFELRVQNLITIEKRVFSYDLIITVVEADQEATWHQGGTFEKYKECNE